MKRLLVDVNVVLDVLLDRAPHAEMACALWAAVERGAGKGLLPAHGITTIFYLVAKELGTLRARRACGRCWRCSRWPRWTMRW